MTRPSHLPDFAKPPLNEVVIGVQFGGVRGYQQIYAKDVWELFRSEFPHVEELPPIPPTFETFGLPNQQQHINFGIVTGASHDRFWFLTDTKDELIQFQHDRLLHNWRKMGDQANEYPRFEKMIERFESEVQRLSYYFESKWWERPKINQCEISYINHIACETTDQYRPDRWFNFLEFESRTPDDFTTSFREIITDDAGKPQGRLICEANSALSLKGQRMIVLTLTARGAPRTPDIASALEFLHRGREMVVKAFADLTTESAQKTWERIS